MSYMLNYEKEGYIKLIYEGNANLNDIKDVITQGVLLAQENNCLRVLSDFRKASLSLSIMELFSIPSKQEVQSKMLNVPFYRYRRAVVVPAGDYKKYKFFENVAVNRSHQVRVFISFDEASNWLMET